MTDFLGKVDQFIQKVETMAGGKPNQKIDTDEEQKIANSLFDKMIATGEATEEDANAIFGFVRTAGTAPAKAPSAKAAGEPDIIINVGNEYNFTININVQNDFEKVINDFLNGGGIENIINMLIKHMGDLGDNILNALVQILNDKFGDKFDFDGLTDLLNQIIDRLDKQNEQIGDLNGKIDDLQNQLVFYAEQNLKALHAFGLNMEELINQVKTSNEKQDKQYELMNKMYEAILELTDKCGNLSIDLQDFTTLITNAIKNGEVKMDEIIELLKSIKEDTSQNKEISNNILQAVTKFGEEGIALGNEILNAIKGMGDKGAEFTQQILALLNDNNTKLDDIKALLKAIKTDTSETKELSQKILEAIEKLGTENTANFTAILNAINNIKAGGGDNTQLEALLQKVLDKMDENTAAIIEAMANIKVEGGTVDLSGIEKMLADLLELTEKNNNLLTDIDAKMDMLNTTAASIEAKLEAEFGKNDNRYTGIMNVLEMINQEVKNNKGYDDTQLLESLDTLLQKMDDIIKKIEDHKVVIDVTGKVECHCNCGNNGSHEGIIDDLNSILRSKSFTMEYFDEITGVDDVTGNEKSRNTAKKVSLKANNEYGLPAGIYIIKNGDIYDTTGRKVAEVKE